MRKLLLLLILPFISQAQTIWTGPMTTFTKLNDADWTLEANQDRITDNVWITRANNQSIFNISDNADTSSGDCDGSSPLDTEWAFGTTADGINTLTFGPFLGTSFADCGPPSVVNQNAVLHLITDDIYIDIKFLFWTSGGNGGGFSYMRSTPGLSGDAGILLNGVVSAESNQIKNVAEPTDAQDAATKNYVDNAGIQGPAGPQGEQGIQGPTGATGPQGPQGEIGPAGADGQDGAVGATGPIGPQGPAGPQGIQGVAGADGTNGSDGADGTDGSSAYEIWVSAGNTGTEAEFLASLVGVQGEPGAQGPQGIQGETGATGSTGPAGPQGPQGIQGVAGNDGADGTNGTNGSSAYEIWIAAGNTGTEAEFLASLVGAQGEQGIQGDTGPQGPAGSGGDGFIDYSFSTLNTFFGSGLTNGNIDVRTMSLNYQYGGYMKLGFSIYNPNGYGGAGNIDIYDENSNLLYRISGNYSGNNTIDDILWAGFKIVPEMTELTFHIYCTDCPSNSSGFMENFLKRKEVVLFGQ